MSHAEEAEVAEEKQRKSRGKAEEKQRESRGMVSRGDAEGAEN
jgi:hypothetical protein